MIVSQIIGGLGNQMFQYSIGRALSLTRGQLLELDITSFNDYELHQGFELFDVFNLPTSIATINSVKTVLSWRSYKLVRKVLAQPVAARLRGNQFIVEPHFHYWPEIHNVPLDCYLVGYWQTENYFMNVQSEIRKDFTFKSLPLDRNAKLVEQITAVNSVSLHVRRGDYVSNPKASSVHCLCSLDYYKSAINYIAERVEQPNFFIFSDDIEWVKKHLKINFACQFIDHNHGAESYNDMRLMSLCRHNIIANSSFSWWGAWLNSNHKKIVVSPEKWFKSNANIDNLIPNGWVSI
jgi:hypothetical protein